MRRGLLADRDELISLTGRVAREPYDRIYDLLRKRCAMILEARPVTETDWRRQNAHGMWTASLTAGRTAQGRIFDLAICHRMDPNGAFRDRAIEELLNLAGWSEWLVAANKRDMTADLCTAECSVAMAVGLDWLADEMTEAQAARCLEALHAKGIAPYLSAVKDGAWWYDCYHNWNAVINSAMALAAELTADENVEAQRARSVAREGLRHFFDALGAEGGWDEGTAYWGYAMRYLMLLARATERLHGDRSIAHQRGMAATCAFGLYFTPMGQSMSFGDSAAAPLYGALYAAADILASREMCWWLDRWAFHRDVDVAGWSDAGLALLLRPESMENLPAIAPPPVKVYPEIGWAAAADAWCEPGLYASVKTGDLSAHHSHLDMNSVQIQVDGETLLANAANPPGTHALYHAGDEDEDRYETCTQAHNTLLVGQRNHRIDARGEIIEAHSSGDHRWITASAGDALGENVRYIRHVAMVMSMDAGEATHLLVLDELRNARPEKAAIWWHSYGSIELDGLRGGVMGRRAGLHLHLAANVEIEADIEQRDAGRLTESALRIDLPACREALVATMFSRRPVQELSIAAVEGNGLKVDADGLVLEFRHGHGHLLFSRLLRTR